MSLNNVQATIDYSKNSLSIMGQNCLIGLEQNYKAIGCYVLRILHTCLWIY